ncbi:Crp/Fnr family transcriptional regulator [Romeria aff. gracilis LEGE 07310]|uniref:Crp/Fnr family transcriptional regulator n=1 Tax=Vasconcelosia minhoensis LEGE 07310 TaxID=915328 RepID=A0A8J7AC40_9CYAN|nr:Crp/Fnr family transcriptional regulator [Romeria gracilis]MBE9076919.1 Crp/Fnr family transcriptional regulator [Romeria aff. gracilis LEGE 07310]
MLPTTEKVFQLTPLSPRRVQRVYTPQSIQFDRREQLPLRAGGCWQIQSGTVRSLTWNPSGDLVPLGFWGAGSLVGYPAMPNHLYEIHCLTPVEAKFMEVGEMAHPDRSIWLDQARQAEALLRISHCRHVETKLLQFICWLAEDFGRSTPEGRLLLLKLTHQEIAESIGATRVTVTRFLKRLEAQGKIFWSGQEKRIQQETFERIRSG